MGIYGKSRRRRGIKKYYFQSIHPVGSFLYYIGAALYLTIFFHPLYLFFSILIIIVINLVHGNRKKLLRTLPFLLLMGLVIFIMNPFLNRRGSHLLFYFYSYPIMLEGVLYGFMLALSLMGMIMLFFSYQIIIDHKRFLFLFGKLFPQTSLLVLLSLRFIPILRRRLSEIMIVQKRRGIVLGGQKLKGKIQNGLLYIQVLLTWSLEEAIQTADSMAARGYGLKKRSSYDHFQWKKRDTIYVVTLVILLLIPLVGMLFLSYGKLIIYPELSNVEMGPQQYIHLLFFCCYLLLPLLVEGREWIRWKS
ncbi:energy-coupling factor transporter transmembrane component T [Bacillus salitolerans]|uniref:Energy-coupling factor transporter transmembrane component T n=1 Tax=Bacillus salitolerans TaxID=1437434 RepID=A0ABW4LU77_9BACI